MALSIVFFKNEKKKNHQEDESHLKHNKNSSHSKRYKKDIKKGENEKWKVQEKSKT